MDKYLNRLEAGQILAKALISYANRDDLLVLALPRGGVPVAFEVAKYLNAPLDVFVVRKLGVPFHPELAFGALASKGEPVFNEAILSELNLSQAEIDAVIQKERNELKRRNEIYRLNKSFPDIKNKTIILVDDGVATGATIRAAILALKQLHPKQIIAAVPVMDHSIYDELKNLVTQIICPLIPDHLYAVGVWYQDFSQTEDEEVNFYLESMARLLEPEKGTHHEG